MKTTIWLTGLSGSGKTTLSIELGNLITDLKYTIIDGDELRKERPKLGFSKEDRISNTYHATYKAMTFLNYTGNVAIVALISPYEEARLDAKRMLKSYANSNFIEVYLDIPSEICESRDPKNLYKAVRKGEISNYTGISSPYEPPKCPDIIIKPDISVDKAAKLIYDKVLS